MRQTYQTRAAETVDGARDFWQQMTGYYTDVTRMDDVRTRATAEALVNEVGIRPGQRVLDAGAGHLRLTNAISRLVDGLDWVAADLTEELLESGRVAPGVRVEKIVADIGDLPMDSASVDAVISARVFQYIPDPPAVLTELKRVVRPGGAVGIVLPNALNLVKRLRYKGRLSTPDEVHGWFESAGFEEVQTGSICFTPPPLGRSWSSPWRWAEQIGRVPWLGSMGGNVIGVGRRP
jgi:SAM-dependent methyltransferase